MKKKKEKTLWGGRFQGTLDPSAQAFSYSLAVDKTLLPYDIKTNIAHVKTLRRAKVLTADEMTKIIAGLEWVETSLLKQDLNACVETVEDVHTLIQMTLEKKIGALAKKLHTARSRNDQVATGTKLYLKDMVSRLVAMTTEYQKALLVLAKKGEQVAIPGYTHLQRAQVVLFAHHLLAYVEMAERDKARLNGVLARVDELPLGSGALAGLAFPLDREYTAKLLGFSKVSANSLDAVSSRDYIAETLSTVAIMCMHFSRLCEDFILWSSQEFSFIEISDGFATGSSIMPHKKNADMLELTRGRTGKAYGNLMSLLTMMKGLPLSYNRDMQEDKEPLFSSVSLAMDILTVFTKMIPEISIRDHRCAVAAHDSFLYATDLMDYVVKKGVALKDAHTLVGKIVMYALDKGVDLSALTIEEYKKVCPCIEEDAFTIFNADYSMAKRKSSGSTNPGMVKEVLSVWQKRLGNK